MEMTKPLFNAPFPVISDRGDCVTVMMLDKDSAETHATTLVNIHNLIPFVRWSEEELLSERIANRVFHNKWDLSLIVFNDAREPVGFLLSYLRPPDDNFECVSVYMHRMAIVRSLQARGLGRQIIARYLTAVFQKVTVDYVTLQANDNEQNARIVALYESLGFRKRKHVVYPDKTDWLMVCPRHLKMQPRTTTK